MKILDLLILEFDEVRFRKTPHGIRCLAADDSPGHVTFSGTGNTPEEAAFAIYHQVPWLADGEIILSEELDARFASAVLKLLRNQSPSTLRAWADILADREIYGIGDLLKGLASALEKTLNAVEGKK
jgi:hypothetical protein